MSNLKFDVSDIAARIRVGKRFFSLAQDWEPMSEIALINWFAFRDKWEVMGQSEKNAWVTMLALIDL